MRTLRMSWVVLGAVSVAITACGNDSDKRKGATSAKAAQPAATRAPVQSQPNEPPVSDPATPEPARTAPAEPFSRPRDRGRVIEITLRSTPPGAEAAVDGQIIGQTPTYWRGPMTGHPREFTFVKADFAMARYRFVPTTNGVVHATLNQITTDQPDAGP